MMIPEKFQSALAFKFFRNYQMRYQSPDQHHASQSNQYPRLKIQVDRLILFFLIAYIQRRDRGLKNPNSNFYRIFTQQWRNKLEKDQHTSKFTGQKRRKRSRKFMKTVFWFSRLIVYIHVRIQKIELFRPIVPTPNRKIMQNYRETTVKWFANPISG